MAILDVGRATLEIASPGHVRAIDDLEVGRRVAGPVGVARAVADAAGAAGRAGAAQPGGPGGGSGRCDVRSAIPSTRP